MTVIDSSRLIARLQAGLERRRALLADPSTNCYRLLTGPSEGVLRLVAERFGEFLILQQFGEVNEATLRTAAKFYLDRLGLTAVYLKQFVRNRGGVSEEVESQMRSPRPFLGEPAAEEITVLENGRRYAVRPYDGFSVGLFLDQRDNRARVAEAAAGKPPNPSPSQGEGAVGVDVLNLFSYTCSFSVAAAMGGADSTTSVDISPRVLDWGRRNFALNGLGLDNHLFFKSDSAEFLKRATRQKRSYDLIILDPPSFAHARRGPVTFSIERDLPELIAGAAGVLRPGGTLLLSTNHRQTSLADLEVHLRQGAGARKLAITARPPLPLDFAMDADHAKSLWARID